MTTKVWNDISYDALRMIQMTRTPFGREVLMPNGEMKLFGPDVYMLPPECFTTLKEPQELLDELLKAGYRPSSNAWSGGHVAALEKHIAFAERMAEALLPSKAT